MFFSKSFGYALRGILYIALTGNEGLRIQVDEIADKLSVPEHFLRKIMKRLVQAGVLNSTKGPYGGFSINDKTLATPLYELLVLMNENAQFDNCVLRLTRCNTRHPCPLHHKMVVYRNELLVLFTTTTVGDLLNPHQEDYIKSIATL